MVKVRSVYGRLGLAASHVDSAMDLRQNNGERELGSSLLARVHYLIR